MMRRRLLLVSPFVVIGVGFLMAQLTKSFAGHARWVPISLIVWATMLLFSWFATDEALRRSWFRPSGGSVIWRFLALLVGLMPLPLFLRYSGVLAPAYLWVPWILFGVINPWIEEMYWRGSVLTAASTWPRWIAILYVSTVFALSHPAIFGVISTANRTIEVTISTLIMGIMWSVIFLRTRSLRWPVFSHFLVDMLSLSVAAFLNTFVPRLH